MFGHTNDKDYNNRRISFCYLIFAVVFLVVLSRGTTMACNVSSLEMFCSDEDSDGAHDEDYDENDTLYVSVGDTVYFCARCNHGYNPDHEDLEWEWEFGCGHSGDDDSNCGCSENPDDLDEHTSHTYGASEAGEYDPTIEVDLDGGSSRYANVHVHVVKVNEVYWNTEDDPTGHVYIPQEYATILYLGARPYPSGLWPDDEPDWELSTEPAGSSADLTCDPDCEGSAYVTLEDATTPGDYVLKARCGTQPWEDITLTVLQCEWQEDSSQTYGYDEFTSSSQPWKSVKDGDSDDVELTTDPSTEASHVDLESENTSVVTVSPSSASNSPETVTVTGTDVGQSDIEALVDSEASDLISTLSVAVYDEVASTKTQVKLVYITDGALSPNTSLITTSGLKDYLKDDVFNQCVANTFSVGGGGTSTVNYDLNSDGKLEVDNFGFFLLNTEPQKIINAANDGTYDYIVFVVKDISVASRGFTKINNRYAFVATDGQTGSGLKRTIAHELGHAFGNLGNITSGDDDNLMSASGPANPKCLRKGQCDTVQAHQN